MHGAKNFTGNPYPTYRPYPFSLDMEGKGYSRGHNEGPETEKSFRSGELTFDDDISDFKADLNPSGHSLSRPLPSDHESSFRPLRLLRSLFSDRLNFLERALGEFESAKDDRETLTRKALCELDHDIKRCESTLAALPHGVGDPERRRNLERQLIELRRDRRRESLLSWRDIVWLKGEIRKIKREIDALSRTSRKAENQEHPL